MSGNTAEAAELLHIFFIVLQMGHFLDSGVIDRNFLIQHIVKNQVFLKGFLIKRMLKDECLQPFEVFLCPVALSIKSKTVSSSECDDLLLYTLQISLDIISHMDIFFHGIIFCGRDINGAIQTKRQASGNVFCVSAIRLDPFPLFLMHR